MLLMYCIFVLEPCPFSLFILFDTCLRDMLLYKHIADYSNEYRVFVTYIRLFLE